jgi:AMP phosphorylase
MIIVPIIAAAGIKIPKTSSRAITSPAGTADVMEVIAPVTFTVHEIEKIVNKTGGCIVWGGGVNFAPADDILIQVETPLLFESFDKIIVSIMAKKVAAGANRVVIDIPVGETMKIRHFEDAEIIAKKFLKLGKRFNIKMTVDINHTLQPAGFGIGPSLEAKDVLSVLERKKVRPEILEKKSLRLAGKLLDLCSPKGNGIETAKDLLEKGKALTKMREIIKAQGGDSDIGSDKIELGQEKHEIQSPKNGEIESVNNKNISIVSRVLGCPDDKKAGMFLNKRIGDRVDKNDILLILYSSDRWRLKEAKDTAGQFSIYKIC